MSTRPIPGDPSEETIKSMLDVRDEEWLITQTGDIETFAVETMRMDGSQWQRVIAIKIPVRRNHGTEQETLRIFIHPESALELAKTIAQTGTWLLKHERRQRRS